MFLTYSFLCKYISFSFFNNFDVPFWYFLFFLWFFFSDTEPSDDYSSPSNGEPSCEIGDASDVSRISSKVSLDVSSMGIS